MNWIKQSWKKVGLGILILVILFVIKGQQIKQSETAVIGDTILSPTPSSEPDEDLPTIGSSEVPDPFDANGGLNDYDKEKYGFLHGGIVGDNGKYTKVIVEDTPIEKPVSISYSNEHRSLNLKSDAEINKIIKEHKVGGRTTLYEDEVQRWQKQVDEQLSMFGEIARQYLPDDAITGYYLSDIDKDGVKEKLITLCSIGSNHCSDYAEVVKGNEVIFSMQLDSNSRGISPANEGFYVSWTDENSFRDVGLCCELYHNKNQFVLRNGQFVPIKQWKVPHIRKRVVGSTDELGGLSQDESLSLIVRNYPTEDVCYGAEGCIENNEIWIKNNATGKERLLVKSGDVSEYPPDKDSFKFSSISNLSHTTFSLDSNKVYFMSSAWTTSGAIFYADVSTGKLHYVSDGNSIDVVGDGPYKGNLKVSKHKYYSNPPNYGSYDHYYIINENGEEIVDLGDDFSESNFWD